MKFYYTREPGTWIMYGLAFVAGALKAERITALTIIVFVSLSLLLMAKTPGSTFLKRKGKDVLCSLVLLVFFGSFGSLYSVFKQPSLIYLYLSGTILLVMYFILLRRGFPALSEVSGMAIMGLVASIAASIGSTIESNLYLWLMFFSFYVASSFRVRFTIVKYRIISGIYTALVLLASGIMVLKGRFIFLSFLPLLEDLYSSVRGKKESFKSLGIISTIKAIVFALLLIVMN